MSTDDRMETNPTRANGGPVRGDAPLVSGECPYPAVMATRYPDRAIGTVAGVTIIESHDPQASTYAEHMETITDRAEIRATDEPDERGDFPCCTTPAPVSGAGLDLDAMARRYSTATDDEVIYEMYPALEAEACRLTARSLAAESVILDQRRMSADHDAFCRPATDRLVARAEAAEAEVVTLWAKVAAVEAKRDEFADLLARALPAVAALARVEALCDSNPDHADTCGSMLTPGAGYPCSCWQADLRAALATTGEGE